MAHGNATRDDGMHGTGSRAPAIVLVEPQLGENIGTAARAMANFGVTDLRLVAPRDGWPSERARAASSGAHGVIEAARVYDTLEAAIADLTFVIATTRRRRDMTKRVEGPAEGLGELVRAAASGPTGILFGRERWGLENDEAAQANIIVTFPVDPAFASLNIAQSVLLMSYEWRRVALSVPTVAVAEDRAPATREEVSGLWSHLVRLLAPTGYFRPAAMTPRMERNLLTILSDADWDRQQVRTLRGVLAHLDPNHERRAAPD